MNKVGANFTDGTNADSFVDNIELQFEGDPSRYKEFISIMKAYKKSRLSDNDVVIRICELLVGYPSLVKEFNAFLPNGYFLVPSEEEEAYITLKTPEGETVYPGDYSGKQLGLTASTRCQ